jgi:hypothetical protein
MTLSLIRPMPFEAACASLEPDLLDVRLHAPTPDTVIVWVAGAVGPASAPLLTLRVRQQFQRASHVILDLSSVTWLDPPVAADLRALEGHAERCGTRLHIAGAENPAIAEPPTSRLRPPRRSRPRRRRPCRLTTRRRRPVPDEGPALIDFTVPDRGEGVPPDPGVADVTEHLMAELGARIDRTAISGSSSAASTSPAAARVVGLEHLTRDRLRALVSEGESRAR